MGNAMSRLGAAARRALVTPDQGSLDALKRRIELLEREKPFTATAGCIRASAFLHSVVGRHLQGAVAHGLQGRSTKIAGQVLPYIKCGGRVLDLGCGDGKVAEKLSGISRMTIADVVDYNKTGMPLVLFDGKTLPFPESAFDNVLVLTVGHHSLDPIALLKEAKRVCRDGGRIIVIESTYFNALHKAFNRVADWFYNNVLNDPRVSVPWNFMTAGGWSLLAKELGLKELKRTHLGIDQPIVPEWHVLYVWEK